MGPGLQRTHNAIIHELSYKIKMDCFNIGDKEFSLVDQ